MIDFNILHGLSTELFSAPEVVNPDLIIEEGCWYLCTDTAELYLGVKNDTTGEFALKKINHAEEAIDPSVIELLNVEINKVKESLNDYAKKTDLPDVSNFITEAEVEAKGYLTAQDINNKAEKEHTHTLAEITDYEAPDFTGYATEEYVSEQIAGIKIPSLDGYAKVSDIPTNVSQLNNDAGYITDISSKADVSHKHDDLYDAKGAAEAIKNELLNGAGDAYNTLKELGDLINDNQDAIEALTTIAAGKADKEHNHSEYLTEHQDISHLATKAELPDVSKFITDIPEEYVTEEELTAKGYLTEHQDLSNYALKSDIPTDYLREVPDEYITETELEAKGFITAHQDLSDYALKSDIPDITGKADAEHTHDEYADKEHTHTEYAEAEHAHEEYLTEHQSLENYYNKEEVNDLIPSLDDYAKTSDIPSLDGYATEQYVTEYVTDAIAAINPTVEEVKTKLEEEVLPIVPTVQETILPTVQKVETEILPAVQELTEKAATQEWVEEQGYITDISGKSDIGHKHDDLYDVKGAAEQVKNDLLNGAGAAYDTLKELGELIDDNQDAIEVLNTVAASKEYVRNSREGIMSLLTTVLLNGQSSEAPATDAESFKNKLLLTGVCTCGSLLSVDPAAILGVTHFYGINANGTITEYTYHGSTIVMPNHIYILSGTALYDVADKEAFRAAISYTLGKCVENITGTDVASLDDRERNILAHIASKGAAPDYALYINASLVTEFVFEEGETPLWASQPDVTVKMYLHKATADNGDRSASWAEAKVTISPADGSAYVSNFEIKTEQLDLQDFVTAEDVNQAIESAIEVKANDIPFDTDKFVTSAIGGFEVGENVKGYTVSQLFAKLLGLSDTKPGEEPDIPDVPGEGATPAEIVDYLIDTETSMYSQDAQGNLVETPFAAIVWTSDEAAVKMDGISTIYHIKDASGNIIESGYQEATDYNEEAWLTIALPNIVTSFKVKQYDGLRNGWYDVQFEMVKAEEQTIEGYTIWTVPEKYGVMSGSTYRFVIE